MHCAAFAAIAVTIEILSSIFLKLGVHLLKLTVKVYAFKTVYIWAWPLRQGLD